MYRQPENHNRVKSIKSKFEGMNPSNCPIENPPKSPLRIPPLNPISPRKLNDKLCQIENNNNETISFNLKKPKAKIDSVAVLSDNHQTNEPCSIPPLNLTRQLNDPLKKGCIKRTPAFRKEKLANSRSKELNFASIFNKFENTDCDNISLETNNNSSLTDIKAKQKLTSSVSLTNDISFKTKPKLVSSASISNHEFSFKTQLKTILHNNTVTELTQTPLNIETEPQITLNTNGFNPTITQNSHRALKNNNIPKLQTDISSKSNKTQNLTIKPQIQSLNTDTQGLNIKTQQLSAKPQSLSTKTQNLGTDTQNLNIKPQFQSVGIKTDNLSIESLSLSTKTPNLSHKTQNSPEKYSNLNCTETLKISDVKKQLNSKESSISVKELIKTMSNKEHELLLTENIKIPEYAQVFKPKKTQNENTQVGLTDTLKAALKQPLPVGPPPKKPPRTFTHTPIPKLGQESQINCSDITPKKDLAEPKSSTSFLGKLNEISQGFKSPKTEVSECQNSSTFYSELNNTTDVAEPKVTAQFCDKLNENLSQQLKPKPESPKPSPKVKSDPKLMLQKLENALLSNRIRSPKLPRKLKTAFDNNASPLTEPNLYTTDTPQKTIFPNCLPSLNCVSSAQNSYAKITPKIGASSTFFTKGAQNSEEPIYAEPFAHQIQQESPLFAPKIPNTKFDTLSSSLHYMSNPVCGDHWSSLDPGTSDMGEQSRNYVVADCDSEPLTRDKLNLIMNRTYSSPNHSDSDIDSLTSTPTGDDLSSPKPQTIRDLIESFEKSAELDENAPKILNPTENRANSSIDEGKNRITLHRTMTDNRKKYVRKVCSTLKRKTELKIVDQNSHLFECCLLVGLNVSTLTPYIKNKFPPDCEVPPWVEHLCFPDASEWSPNSNIKLNQDCQCYSLVITNERGDRKFGYCRRVLPEEASVCLPLTYCIISTMRATGFYHKVLSELESRHGLPFWLQNAFVRELYNQKFPLAGENIRITCLLRKLVLNSCDELIKTQQIHSPEAIEYVKRIQNGVAATLNRSGVIENDRSDSDFKTPKNTYGTLNRALSDSKCENSYSKIEKYSREFHRSNSGEFDQLRPNSSVVQRLGNDSKRNGHIFNDLDMDQLDASTLGGMKELQLLHLPNSQLIHDCLLGDVILKRPYDTRLENVDLTSLFQTLNLVTLLQTFGSLLHERKVIFICSCLSKLSSCVEALQSILYPFNWQHTFIPVLPSNMLDILSAPLPLIAGVLASNLTETLNVEEGIAVDLDRSILISSMGDETDILPKRLRTSLSASLELVTKATNPDDSCRNVLVSDAFVRMFVECCGCYKSHIKIEQSGTKVFERDNFIKHHHSKSINFFLEWFSETAMFHTFIQSHLDGELSDHLFESKFVESNSHKQSAAMLKNSKVTQKMKSFGQKIFHS